MPSEKDYMLSDYTYRIFWKRRNYRENKQIRSQDGRGVGGRGVHLSPQMHQEYNYKWNNSHRTQAEH